MTFSVRLPPPDAVVLARYCRETAPLKLLNTVPVCVKLADNGADSDPFAWMLASRLLDTLPLAASPARGAAASAPIRAAIKNLCLNSEASIGCLISSLYLKI